MELLKDIAKTGFNTPQEGFSQIQKHLIKLQEFT